MRAVVVYESMYGNTHQIADAIGAGLEAAFDVRVVPVSHAGPEVIADADLVVVGGPTHAHGMSRASTRKAAVQAADKPVGGLTVEPDALARGCVSGSARSATTRSGRRALRPGATGHPRKVRTTGRSGKNGSFSHLTAMVHVPALIHACCRGSGGKGPGSPGQVPIDGNRSPDGRPSLRQEAAMNRRRP